MAMFVHLTPAARVDRIRRAGIARLRKPVGGRPGGVFAVPVTRSFYVSHQWLRELKRAGAGPVAGVYFRIPDDEPVWVGHYGGGHVTVTAAEAVAVFLGDAPREGWEVIVPRRVEAGEIHRTRPLPQVVGWRYAPGAHGKAPCACEFCTRGTFGGAKVRARASQGPAS